ncbi:MAG: NOB1 family endonuclease [Candidatus Heimdallarchaeota archaeon]
MDQVLVIDTGVILHSKQLFWNKDAHFVTVPSVLEEIIDQKNQIYTDLVLTQKLLKIISPKDLNILFVQKKGCEYLGEIKNLSKTDIDLVALAFELKKEGKNVIICSHDLSIQNLANYLGLMFWGEKKIKNRIEWEFRCRGCGKTYSNKELDDLKIEMCCVCGSELRRFPNKTIQIRKNSF